MDSLFLHLKNVSFTDLNMVEKKSQVKLNLGGCVRTLNILQREIIQLIVINAYSDETNVGIKIIDNFPNINFLIAKINTEFIVK